MSFVRNLTRCLHLMFENLMLFLLFVSEGVWMIMKVYFVKYRMFGIPHLLEHSKTMVVLALKGALQ